MASSSNPNTILVNEKQRGNPVLSNITNTPWTYQPDITPDYIMGSTCAIFISLKYHSLHPQYAGRRITEIGKNYRLRVLLALVDDENNLKGLQELNKLAFSSDFTLIYAWSNDECARYLEAFKLFENKSAASIQEKVETEYLPLLTSVLTNVRSINKTDVSTLIDTFGSFQNICNANEEQLLMCNGLGEKKVHRLYRTLNEPFKSSK